MKKLVILLLMASLRHTYADSQSAHIYGTPTPPNSISDDFYFIRITWLAAPGTPDGVYAVDMVYDGGAPGLFRPNIQVSNGVCNPATEDYFPGPAGHEGRVLYIGEGNHTWHWQGTHVSSAEDANLAVSWVPYTGLPGGIGVVVQGNTTITIGETATPTPTPPPPPSPTSDKPNDPHDGGNGADGEDENGGDHRSDPECTHGMARYTADLLTASLRITDTPLEYFPPVGPKIDFIIAYRQRDTDQSPAQQYSHLSPNWTFNWMSYVTDDPVNLTANAAIYVRGGGTELHTGFNSASQSYLPDPQSHAVLVRTSASTYEKRFPDGSKQVFGPNSNGATAYPRRLFMTQAVDAIGNIVEIRYFPQTTKIEKIIDPLNQQTHFSYEDASDPYRITKVTDPFGRSALFGYTGGKLTSATDPVGIASHFGYAPGTYFINSLITPYGETTFSWGESGTNRWLNMLNVTTGAAERVEYRDNAPGIPYDPAGTVPTGGFVNDSLGMRNSFYWSKKALSMYPPANGVYNYTKAKITHWLLSSDGSAPVATAASEKMPLENRVWYTYAGQPNYSRIGPTAQPEKIARVLADGTTQLSQFEYNSLGNVTTSTDPVGRRFTNVYAANGIDLLERRQTRGTNSELLASFTYNAQHLPVTWTNASGQTTTVIYNSRGQKLSSQNPKLETTTYAYGGTVPDGYLKSITSPLFNNVSAVTEFTYDTARRILTTTDSDQYVLTFEYDDLDRPTKTTFPDGTWQEAKYIDNVTNLMTLDVTRTRDRLGRWSYKHYNSDKQLNEVTDALGRVTRYGWCACGSLETITDANTHVTTFLRDLQGRVYRKVFDDNTAIDYLFEGQTAPDTAGATSRLQSSTDARGRRTNYSYFADDSVSGISYTDTAGGALSPPTPSVNYTYDPNYKRIATMTDGTGVTAYDYYPIESSPALGAGSVHTVDGPLANDTIAYTYDQLGRTLSQSINGVAETVAYDSLGRLTTTDNVLGHFSRAYYGVTPRLQTLGYPNGQNANYVYFGNNKDRRLQTLENLHSGAANLSSFDYTYDSEGQIQTWNKVLDANTSNLSLSYDDAGQLTGVSQASQETGYQYDAAGNRIADSVVDGALFSEILHSYTPNNLNQIASIQETQNGSVIMHGGLVYDLAGNLTDDGEGKTFEWDAANRLIAIDYSSGERTEFVYDGLGRRVKNLEYGPGVTAVIEPADYRYNSYNTAPLALPAGEYTITFQALDGGADLMLIDAVTLTNISVPDGSFETVDVSGSPGGYEYGPNGSTWTFGGQAGIAGKASDLTVNNPDAPEGSQVGFVQGTGSISQTQSISAGTYSLSFEAAQGGDNTGRKRVRVTLRPSVTSAQVKTFLWCGTRICEERNSTGASVTKRFFEQGEQRIGGSDAGNYYYSHDHLRSVREVTNSSGSLVARYDYDAYGKAAVVEGNMTVDFGYTGHYFHAPSGLNLTLYRAYNPALGRWISRDPIGEAGGVNLYGYVENNPVDLVDPLGLADVDVMTGMTGGAWWSERYPTRYTNVRELVSIVLSALPPGERLDRLTIHSHAQGGAAYFGAGDDDFVFGSRVPADVNAALMQLRSLFSENGSIVFAQCEVGKGDSGRQTLQTVADLAGVPTVGSQGLYHDLTGFDVAPFAMLPRRP